MMMLNNSNINTAITYPMPPCSAAFTTAATLPTQGYNVLGQPYHGPAIFISSAMPFAHVGVPQATGTISAGATAPVAATISSNNIQSFPTMNLSVSGSLTNSNTQLPSIQSMLNSNLESATATATDAAPAPLTNASAHYLSTPSTTTKRSSVASSATTSSIVLPPLGFTNSPTQTPVTTPVPICTSIRSSSPVIKNYTHGAVPVSNIDQQYQLPHLSTQFRPCELNTMNNSASSSSFSSLIFKDNNLGRKIMTNPISVNSSITRQQVMKNFSFVPQSNDYHIAKNGTIMKKSGIQAKSIVERPSTVSPVGSTDSSSQTTSRRRRRTTKEQRQILKEAFRKNKAPSKEERLSLAQQCNMSEKAIQVWFQNQRQYMRREQNLRALQFFQIIS